MSDPNRPQSDTHQPPPSAFSQPGGPPGAPPHGQPPGGHIPTVPYASTGYPGAYIGPPPTPEERTWGMLAHLSALAGFIVPLGNILGPLIVWLIKKDQMPFVNDQGKESLNFQIMITIVAFVAALTICIGIGIILLPAVAILAIVFEIIAAVQANSGAAYRYPVNLRLIK